MFYEIELKYGYEVEDSTVLTYTSKFKKIRPFWKDQLINEFKCELDERLVSTLNWHFKDCQFDFLQAYRNYGVIFNGGVYIKNRITKKRDLVYGVWWNKDYWNLKLKQYQADKLELK